MHKDIEKLFMPDTIAAEWEQLLLHCIPNECHLHEDTNLYNPDFELKRFKEIMRRIKKQVSHTLQYHTDFGNIYRLYEAYPLFHMETQSKILRTMSYPFISKSTELMRIIC